MIDPNGPKPGSNRRPDIKEPHFEQDAASEQPMYATDPDEPGESGGSRGAGNYDAGWDVPGAAYPGRPQDSGAQAPGSSFAGNAGEGGERADFDKAGREAAGDPPGGSRPGVGEAELGALKEALAAAEAQAKEAQEQYLRALAEMENVRRRAQEDVSKAHKFAIESFAESLLPVRDSLEMALTVEVPSVESMREGVEATLRQLTQAFERNRLLVIDPLHQKFDPHLHQAISMAPSKDVAPNHVVSVLQKGYMINDRILRPALVTVSQPA
jgi:molecular chaperone GrpE